MDPLYIAICWLVGSAVYGLVGWMKSNAAWDTKKFLASLFGGASGAIIFGLGYHFTGAQLTSIDILTAIAAGMGAGAGVPVVSGAITARAKQALTSMTASSTPDSPTTTTTTDQTGK